MRRSKSIDSKLKSIDNRCFICKIICLFHIHSYMNNPHIPQQVIEKIGSQIDAIWANFEDIEERTITIQLIPRVVENTISSLYNSLDQNDSQDKFMKENNNNKYIFLQKKFSGDIVFPSWSIEKYETYKGRPNPQGIILASLREFKEEMHELLSLDADNIIDVYPCIPFETSNGKKYIQFRLLAYVPSNQVLNIEEKFQRILPSIPENQQEHSNCYIKWYREVMDEIIKNNWKLKYSTHHSLEYHAICNRWGKYYNK